MRLPEFPLGRTGSHEFLVEGLGSRAFPYKLDIETTRANGSSYHPRTPFESAVLRVEILDANNQRVLDSKTFRPTTWHHTGEGEFEQIFWNQGQPRVAFRSSYRIRVTVLKPSWREWDKASLVLR